MFGLFKNPPLEYRVIPFLIWNIDPDIMEIERQVREMYRKGIGGFIIHVTQAQYSDELIRCILYSSEIAKELGMHMHVYDDNLPSHFRMQLSNAGIPLLDDTWNPHASDYTKQGLKLASSEAHIDAEPLMPFTVGENSDWSFSLEQMKNHFDQQAVLGGNLLLPKGFVYSIAGNCQFDAPPPQFYQATYWPYYKVFADYAARLCYALSLGRHVAQIALLFPAKGDKLTQEYFKMFCKQLPKEHLDFDVLREESIRQATVLDQSLLIADESYQLLIIPPIMEIGYETALKIQEFVEDGGSLLGSLQIPCKDANGNKDEEVRSIFRELFGREPVEAGQKSAAELLQVDIRENGILFIKNGSSKYVSASLLEIISNAIKPEVSVRHGGKECHDIAYIHRSLGEDGDLFFFTNVSGKSREVQLSIRCDCAPHILDLETGESRALINCTQIGSRTIFMHRFERHGSLLLCFTDDPSLTVPHPPLEGGDEIILPDRWTFKPLQYNYMPLQEWNTDTEGQSVHYSTAFQAYGVPTELYLVITDNNMSYKVDINGQEAIHQVNWLVDVGFVTLDITPYIRKGNNKIKVIVPDQAVHKDLAKMLLMGSFSINQANNALVPAQQSLWSGSWTEQGYPYYSGTASYSQTIRIPSFLRNQHVFLIAENPADMVEFVVNGATVGVRPWPPFEVDITPLVKPGPNEIELRVTNSLANAISSEVRPSGLIGGARIVIY